MLVIWINEKASMAVRVCEHRTATRIIDKSQIFPGRGYSSVRNPNTRSPLLCQTRSLQCGHLSRRPSRRPSAHGRWAEFPHLRKGQARYRALVDIVSVILACCPRVPHVRWKRQKQPLVASNRAHTRSLTVEASLADEAAWHVEGPGCWFPRSQLTFDASVSTFAAER